MLAKAGRMCFGLLLLGPLFAQSSGPSEASVNEKGKMVQSMKIEAPAMTEEDHYGPNMPEQYRCDSCKAVLYHLEEALRARQPKSRRLHEWEYLEIVDETCRHGFKGYGVKKVGDANVLSGPGLKHEDNLPLGGGVIQMGGEKWEQRLGEICRKIVYEKIGEDELHEQFRKEGTLSPSLCLTTTRDCQVQKANPKTDVKSKGKNAVPNGQKIEKTSKQSVKEVAKPQDSRKKSAVGSPTLDAHTFLKDFALDQNLPTDTFTKKRSRKEWEKAILQMAGQLYAKSAGDEHVVRV
jgi:hypothetical protein